jgi:glycopeptide antibiotics resistance protein
LALLILNTDYSSRPNYQSLSLDVDDLESMLCGSALRFRVVKMVNPTKYQVDLLLQEKSDGIVFILYCGHGVTVHNEGLCMVMTYHEDLPITLLLN